MAEERAEGVLDSDVDDALIADVFGEAAPALTGFTEMLHEHGLTRGLIGPRETNKVWDRHIANSAAAVPFLQGSQLIADVGSGAGLPGVVIAAMLPKSEVYLIEPMERRCAWLAEVAETLNLTNITVKRGRAEEYFAAFEADAVTARAVAAMGKLAKWTLPLLKPGGILVALKGQRAAVEIEEAKYDIRKLKGEPAEILPAPVADPFSDATVVRVKKVSG